MTLPAITVGRGNQLCNLYVLSGGFEEAPACRGRRGCEQIADEAHELRSRNAGKPRGRFPTRVDAPSATSNCYLSAVVCW